MSDHTLPAGARLPQTPATLSLVVITLNEERNLRRCLASVAGLASQILVLDSGSEDRTREIAEAAGAQFHTQPFLGYGRQKQKALELATGEWVLSLDADEWLDAAARKALQQLLEHPPSGDVTGCRLELRSFYLGRWNRLSPWSRERKLRLVRRGCAYWKADDVHEALRLRSGRKLRLDGAILHHPYRDISHQIATINRYTELLARRAEEHSMPRVWLGMSLEPVLVFLQHYLLYGKVLRGSNGLIESVLRAFYFFLRYAKIWQRKRGLDKLTLPE